MIKFIEIIWKSKNYFCTKNELTEFDGLGTVDSAQLAI